MILKRYRGLTAALLLVLTLIPVTAFAAAPKTGGDEEPSYTAERAIIRDAKTGALRMPNPQEIDEMVRSIRALTNRSTGGLRAQAAANGAEMIDLEGRFNNVVLARPTEEGGMETVCVNTFEDAVAFLGLRPIVRPDADAKPAKRGSR